LARWLVIETDGYVEGKSLFENGDNLIACFDSREEAEAYVSADEETRERLAEEELDKFTTQVTFFRGRAPR
jgi:hypothetical protein